MTTQLITPLLTPAELSAHLGVPENTLRDWRYQRKGPRPVRVGKYVRYRGPDVDSWLEAGGSATS